MNNNDIYINKHNKMGNPIIVKNEIKNRFNADVIEMESAAIAQVCYLDKVPFIVIRSISDKPNGKNQITFDEFLRFASKRCAIFYYSNQLFHR